MWYSYVKDIWSDSHLIRVLVFFLRPFGRECQKLGCYCKYYLKIPFLYNIYSHSFQLYNCCTRYSNVQLTENLNLHLLLCVPWKTFIWWCQFMVLSCQWKSMILEKRLHQELVKYRVFVIKETNKKLLLSLYQFVQGHWLSRTFGTWSLKFV